MSLIDCNSKMNGFHSAEVTLSKSEQDVMRDRRNAGRTRLRSGLDNENYPHPEEIVSQGSYQMRTMVLDADCDYDIDDGAYFSQEDMLDEANNPLMPRAARERVCKALKRDTRLGHEAEVKRNCVRQMYPDGYHIDVPVYRMVTTTNDADKEVEHYELASGDEWIKSDARTVTRWYNDMVGELNTGESDGSQMRRVTKLTKKLARSRGDWKPKTTSGICISKLVTDHFVHVDHRDDQALRETWDSIQEALNVSTEIKHPVQDTNLADSEDAEVKFFCECLRDALEKLDILDKQDCDLKQALSAWDDVFNTTYFSNEPGNANKDKGPDDGGKRAAPLVVTSRDTSRRNDGGGRFG